MLNRITPYKPTAAELEREWTGKGPEQRSNPNKGTEAAKEMRAKINEKTLLQRLFG